VDGEDLSYIEIETRYGENKKDGRRGGQGRRGHGRRTRRFWEEGQLEDARMMFSPPGSV